MGSEGENMILHENRLTDLRHCFAFRASSLQPNIFRLPKQSVQTTRLLGTTSKPPSSLLVQAQIACHPSLPSVLCFLPTWLAPLFLLAFAAILLIGTVDPGVLSTCAISTTVDCLAPQTPSAISETSPDTCLSLPLSLSLCPVLITSHRCKICSYASAFRFRGGIVTLHHSGDVCIRFPLR